MNVLITGGAGNVGSALANRLSQNTDNHVVVIDNLSTGNENKLPKRDTISFYEADVNNREDLVPIFNSHSFDFVFHYA